MTTIRNQWKAILVSHQNCKFSNKQLRFSTLILWGVQFRKNKMKKTGVMSCVKWRNTDYLQLLTLVCEMAISTCFAVTKACVTRIAFAVHSFLVVWRVTDVTGKWTHWFLLTSNVLLLIELLYTCIKRRGQEWKWFV